MSRRLARQTALQVLYQVDIAHCPVGEALADRLSQVELPARERDYVTTVVTGVQQHQEEIDDLLSRFAKDWPVERMATVDRNIMRLAVFELKYQNTPVKVSINEAVELAKLFSDERGAKFVNGILASVVQFLGYSDSDD